MRLWRPLCFLGRKPFSQARLGWDAVLAEVRRKIRSASTAMLLAAGLPLITGCVSTTLMVSNASSSPIKVVRGGSRESLEIAPQKARTISHGYGLIQVLDVSGNILVAGRVNVLDLNRQGYGGPGSIIPMFSTIRAFTVFTDSGLYAALRAERHVPSVTQPQGFPIVPTQHGGVIGGSP